MTSDKNRVTHTREISADGLTCTFVLAEAISPNRTVYYGDANDAAGQPLLQALFQVPFVESALTKNSMMIVAQYGGEWDAIIVAVDKLLEEHLHSVPVEVEAAEEKPDSATILPIDSPEADSADIEDPELDQSIRERVQVLLENEINPSVAMHGGFINLTEVKNRDIYLFMGGGCQGCGMAAATLRQGVEAAIRAQVPEVRNILDGTDHSAGENPYFPSEVG
jgi:Fe-S cluster biogenesis protein NfuA